MRILLVEDDSSVRGYIIGILSKDNLSLKIDIAETGDDGLTRYLELGPYDLVITDYGHPGLFGNELVEAIRAKNPGQAILLQTGNTGEHIEAFKRQWQDIPVLPKPWRAEEFRNLVRGMQKL
jgi:DNA-binding response OmpR family regulator